MNPIRKTALAAGLSLSLAACAGGPPESGHNVNTGTDQPTLTQPNPETKTPLQRSVEMWHQAIADAREKMGQQTEVAIQKDTCIYWEAFGGYTIIKNPVLYKYDQPGESL